VPNITSRSLNQTAKRYSECCWKEKSHGLIEVQSQHLTRINERKSSVTSRIRFEWEQIPVAARSKRGSSTTRLLGLRVRNPPGAWICLSWMLCFVRCPYNGPIPRPQKSYLVCVCVCVCVCVWSVIRCNNNPLHLQSVGRKRPE